MKKITLLGLALLASATAATAQQLPNVGFEEWKSTCGNTTLTEGATSTSDYGSITRPGVEPSDWNGSNSAIKLSLDTYDTSDFTQQETSSPYYGSYSALIKNSHWRVTTTVNKATPGFITLGTPWIFIGSGITYFTRRINWITGGIYGGQSFTTRPDAITGWYKHDNSSGSENAHIIAYLWAGSYKTYVRSKVNLRGTNETATVEMYDEAYAVMGKTTPEESGTLVASCDYSISDNLSEWTQITVPLTYNTTTTLPEKMNVILSSGNFWDYDSTVEGNTLTADNVDFVYYSTLTSLAAGNEAIVLQDGVYTYYNSSTTLPSADQISYETKSQFATATVAIDEDNAQVVVTVTNQGGKDLDGETQHVYTIQYAKAYTYDGYVNVEYTASNSFDIYYTTANKSDALDVLDYGNGTAAVTFPMTGAQMSLDDITISCTLTEDEDGYQRFEGVGTLSVTYNNYLLEADLTLIGSITADGVTDFTLKVTSVDYAESSYEGIDVNAEVYFSTNKWQTVVSGYYFALEGEDAAKVLVEQQPATLTVTPANNSDTGLVEYTIELGDLAFGTLSGTLTTVASYDDDVYAGTNVASTLGSTACTVDITDDSTGEGDAKNYEIRFVMTGDIYNTVVFTSNSIPAGVGTVDSLGGVRILGLRGEIAVSGCEGEVRVYSTNGSLVATRTGDGRVSLAPGLYFVSAGGASAKVIVK